MESLWRYVDNLKKQFNLSDQDYQKAKNIIEEDCTINNCKIRDCCQCCSIFKEKLVQLLQNWLI